MAKPWRFSGNTGFWNNLNVLFLRIDGKATRIDNAIVINKVSAQAPVQFKGDELRRRSA